MRKITVVGAGRVGETTAQILAQQSLCDEIVLLDIREGAAAGAALDIRQSASFFGFDSHVAGGTDAVLMEGSDLVIVTAGSPRKPGMSRSDVLDINCKVIDGVVDDVLEHAPDAMLLLITNPVDVLTQRAWQRTGWSRNRVFGQAGVLDSARMASFIAEETGFSSKDIRTMVIGGHGDLMVPLTRFSTINGVSANVFMDAETVERVNEKTRHGGAEVLSLRQNSSAFVGPAAAVASMVDSICNDRHRLLPSVCVLDGEYGMEKITAGVPAILGKNGVEKVVELPLDSSEADAFRASVDSIRADLKKLS